MSGRLILLFKFGSTTELLRVVQLLCSHIWMGYAIEYTQIKRICMLSASAHSKGECASHMDGDTTCGIRSKS